MKKILIKAMLSLLPLIVIGCGSDSSSNSVVASSLSSKTEKSEITFEKDKLFIDLKLINNYDTSIGVAVDSMNLSVPDCSIERTEFTPDSITFKEESSVLVRAKVFFSSECTPSSYTFGGKSTISLDGGSKVVDFNLGTTEITPTVLKNTGVENNGTNGHTNNENNSTNENNTTENNTTQADTINYAINFSLSNQSVKRFHLEEKRSFKIALVNADTNKSINSARVKNITVVSKQANLLKLFDANTNTIPSGTLTFENQNDLTIYTQTYTRSGLADIDIIINYINNKGKGEVISRTYSTMILSGPPTAFSINTAGISYNTETKWFENKFLISAVDKYNNIVNISPTIYVSAMTGFTRDSHGKEVLYGNFGNVEGKLNVDKDSKKATFEANASVFDNIDINRDYLYVFGKVDDYEALGKWDIDSYKSSHTETTLALSEDFNGENHNNLGFALGHNYIIDPGSSESSEWQVKIDSTDGKYQLDEEGKAFVTLKFPPYIVGKRTALAVNFLGKTPETGKVLRSGEVKFKTLKSFQGVITPDAISVDKNTTKHVRVYFDIDTGTNDIWSVLNSHVWCRTKSSNIVSQRIYQNTIVSTVEEFKRYGEYKAYWDLTLEAKEDKDGSFSFQECQVKMLPRF